MARGRLSYPGMICCAAFMASAAIFAAKAADPGIVSKVTSSPVYANGIVTDNRTGINIFLQRPDALGDRLLDPAITGFGIEPGGRMEVELLSGFERDLNIALDSSTILLVAGTPQQAITAKQAGYQVSEGGNPNTFRITPTRPEGMNAEQLIAGAPAARYEPIPQRGIKIIHIGRNMAFTNRGESGAAAVRFYGADGQLTHSGRAELDFLAEPLPQVFPTNIPDDKRNRNWQRVRPGTVVGVDRGTLPLSLLLFERNEGFGNAGIEGVGVVPMFQLNGIDQSLSKRFNAGLLIKDADGDGVLDPKRDPVIGGVRHEAPEGAKGHFPISPQKDGRPYLSRPTGELDPKAASRPGGSILDVFYVAGDTPGLYRVTFSLFRNLLDPGSGTGSTYSYSVVVE
ncbi:MAG: hypothetical protein AAF724_07735 [Pseudomonadota bacterium]